jgi:cell division cycle 2-like protein
MRIHMIGKRNARAIRKQQMSDDERNEEAAQIFVGDDVRSTPVFNRGVTGTPVSNAKSTNVVDSDDEGAAKTKRRDTATRSDARQGGSKRPPSADDDRPVGSEKRARSAAGSDDDADDNADDASGDDDGDANGNQTYDVNDARVFTEGCRSVDCYQRLNEIEEGSYGVVYRAKDVVTGEVFALKKIKLDKEADGFPITALREIYTLMTYPHANVVLVKEMVVGSTLNNIYMVMEFIDHDLKALMDTMKQPFSVAEVKCLMKQLLSGIAHLHDNWILHRYVRRVCTSCSLVALPPSLLLLLLP